MPTQNWQYQMSEVVAWGPRVATIGVAKPLQGLNVWRKVLSFQTHGALFGMIHINEGFAKKGKSLSLEMCLS